ncbi:MAG: hypothetical protein M1832_002310 [Thelocarpon impressellum]|nr:MAG: hypothetical protein M1832_002310 [Thelocarpon impressellum]
MGEIFLDFQMGMDVGSTICFAIYGPHFYALSNQTAYLAEEISWKSNYQCVRFPLESPKQELVEKQADIWRRCHQEGPINDSWTDLNLKVDERTGELVIVEARREWSSGTSKDASNSKKRGASGAKRTYYMQPLHFQGQVERAASSSAAVSSFDGQQSGGSCPLDPESLIGDVSPLDRSHYCNASLRLPRHVHLGDDGTAETSPSFILFRTKCRFYSPSCQAYLDLVDDAENLPPEDDQVLWQRLRLRVGSRQRAPPAFTTEGLLAPRRLHRETRELIPGSEEVYRRRPGGVKLWPPPRPRPGAPRNPELDKLEALLNPIKFPAGTGHVVGMADERSLLYLTGPPATGATAATSSKAMVLVSFDNWIGPSGRAWARYMMGPASPSPCSQTLSRELLPPTSTRRRTPTSPTTAEMSPHLTNALLGRPHEAGASWSSSNWAAREPAMYRFLDGGRWLQRNVRAALRSCEQEAGEDFGTE